MPTTRTPFVIVGDAPGQLTGLARIAGDLAAHLYRVQDELNLDVRVVGHAPWTDLVRTGVEIERAPGPWRQWQFADLRDLGASALSTAYRTWFGDTPGIVFTIWDPSRCFTLTTAQLPVDWWGYFPIDAENVNGGISGPAAAALAKYTRVLAYTQFGARVMQTAHLDGEIEVLPHGLDGTVWHPALTPEEYAGAVRTLGTSKRVIGCVATNQPRKDLGMYCQALAQLLAWGESVHGWLHIDREVSEAWSIPQLAHDLKLDRHLTVTTRQTDRQLAALYSLCSATIAPGRGEGFGYPIVESQACGTPCVHVDYAGGAEFTPYTVLPVHYHLVGPYALKRPIMDSGEVADYIRRCFLGHPIEPNRAVHQSRVAHLAWTNLWPLWQDWIRRGLTPKETD